MSERKAFDGLGTKPDPVPFDAHEQVVRSHHTHALPRPGGLPDEDSGYQSAEYPAQEHPHEHGPEHEYPKMIDDGVIVHSKEEEEKLKADVADEAAAE
jgi:hypothetical protein